MAEKIPQPGTEPYTGMAGGVWVSDITYIGLSDGHSYLSLVTDAYSRKIVGYHLSEQLTAEGPLTALKMAISTCGNTEGLIHHSDRGCQYCCNDYVEILQRSKISISMTQSGDPRDNAIAERVNGILKSRAAGRCIYRCKSSKIVCKQGCQYV